MSRAIGGITAVCLGLALAVHAADDTALTADVDARKIGLMDQVQLTISLQGRSIDLAEPLALPPLKNLRVAGGPFESSQFSFVNGTISQGKTFTYVLQPTAVGQAEIGAVRVKLRSGERSTEPIAIEVVPGRLNPAGGRGQDPFGADPFGADPLGADPFDSIFGRRQRAQPAAQPKLFVEAVASRNRLYVGEPLLLTYYLYTQTAVTDLQFAEPPKFAGFWAEDLERMPGDERGEGATAGGESYRRFPVFRKLLFPTKAGKLTIAGATVRLGLGRQTVFDPGPITVQRATKAVSITVDAVPQGADFSGAVGSFRASASVDKKSLPLGEAVTVRFRVEGSGNLKWVDRGPELKLNAAKVYPPQVKSDLKTTVLGISGAKTWEYVVVPETAGALEIPSLAFSFFDPKGARIERLDTASMRVEVEGSAGGTLALAPAAPGQVLRNTGGLPLRGELDLPTVRVPELGSRRLAWALVALLGLHALLWGSASWTTWRRQSSGRAAPRATVKTALADIARAGKGRMSKEAAAGLIEKALTDIFGAVEGAAPGERERAAQAVVDEVRFLRYAPQLGDYSEKIRQVAVRAAEVVRRWA